MNARPNERLNVTAEGIPRELQTYRQWVVWCAELRNSKLTKVPYDAKTGRHASVTDARTWATYADALAAIDRGDQYAGVGFVLTAGDPFTAIDLDHVIDETGVIDAQAQRIVGDLDSYSEFSPSGSGLRILLRGTLPPGRRRRRSLEMYDRERYVTVTGQALNNRSVEERQEALEAVHTRELGDPVVTLPMPPVRPRVVSLSDRELLLRALQAKNGAAFGRLWSGDASAHGGDQSAADLALACHLCFWTGRDAARVTRLFRLSALHRPKFDERRGDSTYGAITIQRALAVTREAFGA